MFGNTIIFNKPAGGYLVDDTYIEFKIPQTGSPNFELEIDGTQIGLKKGDTVRFVINGNQNTGDADFTTNQITKFYFNVDVFINGEIKGSGLVTKIYFSPYESFSSTLAFHMPSIMAGTQLTADGVTIIDWSPETNDIVDLTNIGLPSNGAARIDITSTNTYIVCSGYYVITPV